MNFHSALLTDNLITIHHDSHIRGNDGRNACLMGCINNLVHQGDVLTVDNSVDGKVALDAVSVALLGYLAQVIDSKVIGRVGTHVELFHTEVDGTGTGLQGCSQGVAAADRGHDFVVLYVVVHSFFFFDMSLCRFLLLLPAGIQSQEDEEQQRESPQRRASIAEEG